MSASPRPVAPERAAGSADSWRGALPVRRVRLLITLFFALDGLLFAEWVVRVPQVKSHVGASPGLLGLALLGVSAGAVLTMTATGRLCSRFGSRRVTVGTAVLFSVAEMLPALMPTVAALGGALLIFGAAYGGLNVAMNSAAVDVVDELEQPVMPTFHAAYSFGGLAGSVTGGFIAAVLGPAWHLALVGLFGLAATAVIGTLLLRCPTLDAELRNAATTAAARSQRTRRPLFGSARRAGARSGARSGSEAVGAALPATGTGSATGTIHDPAAAAHAAHATQAAHAARRLRLLVYVFGCIALCSAFGEGSLADWGALHLRTDLHTSVALAAAGYASFSVAMLIGRSSGAWVLRKAGRTVVLAGGGATAAVGMLIAALVPSLPLALFGFILVGLGLANLFPAAIGQAGALTGPSGVATASTFGYGGMLCGPPLIGFLADRLGLPIALTTISVLAGAAAVIAVLAARSEAALADAGLVPDADAAGGASAVTAVELG